MRCNNELSLIHFWKQITCYCIAWVNYCYCNLYFAYQENRVNGIHYALCRIASPVAMAAFTTSMAGILMLFSSILAYVQIGTFLIVLSFISWTYSTIFHLVSLSYNQILQSIKLSKILISEFVKYFRISKLEPKNRSIAVLLFDM
jgi:hypothetical protein